MQSSDAKKFAALLKAVADSYNKEVTAGMREIYWESLKRYEYAEVRGAFSAHVTHPEHGRFWPKPADIIRQLEGDPGSNALMAFEKLRRAIKAVGPYRDVVFDDPLIHACVDQLGGWERVNEWTDEDLPYRCTDFQKLYTGLVGRAASYPPVLTGIAHNSLREAQKLPAPILLGDKAAATAVMGGGSTQGRLGRESAQGALQSLSEQVVQ